VVRETSVPPSSFQDKKQSATFHTSQVPSYTDFVISAGRWIEEIIYKIASTKKESQTLSRSGWGDDREVSEGRRPHEIRRNQSSRAPQSSSPPTHIELLLDCDNNALALPCNAVYYFLAADRS
jgi:hypothetical protein